MEDAVILKDFQKPLFMQFLMDHPPLFIWD